MRVHLFLGRLDAGGAQRQFLQLARGLRVRGHRVRLSVVQPGGRFWEDVGGGSEGIEALWPSRADTAPGRAWQYGAAWRRLRRSTRDFHADVLYTALYPSNFVGRVATLGRIGPPLVWGIRASALPRSWPRELWIRAGAFASGGVDLAIANSEAGRRHHENRGYHPRSWAVVPNGIDTDRFRADPGGRRRVREEWDVPGDRFLVGLVGRLAPMKGHPDFLRAAARVSERRPDVAFTCVGGGPAPYREDLEEVAREMGVVDRVRWTGERRDMAAVYSALDLLVLSSVGGEGFPNVVGEAMACGTPCVVTDVGDAARVVGPAGRVVPPGRPDLLAKAIGKALEGRADAGPSETNRGGSSPGETARKRIADCFSVERFVERTEDLLAGIARA